MIMESKRPGIGELAKSVYDNPIVTKEFRTRMRGKKAYLIMGGYALFLCVVLCITFFNYYAQANYSSDWLLNSRAGLWLFSSLTWTQAILLALIVPALTCGSLTGELENKTIEMLALTRISAGKTVLGKQLSGFLYAMILLACSVPLAGTCLMFGGISPAEIAITYALLIGWAFLFTCAGVFFSSLFKRTSAATLVTYIACLAYTFFSGVAFIDTFFFSSYKQALCLVNPGYGPQRALGTASICGISAPLAAVALWLNISLGVLLLLIASTHIRHMKAARSLPIRLMLIFISVGLMWLTGGRSHSSPWTPYTLNDLLGTDSLTALFFLAAAASLFATGEIRKPKSGSVFSYAISPLKAFTDDLGGAISFMALWTAATYAALGLSYWWGQKASTGSVSSEFVFRYIGVSIAAVAIIVGISAVGVLMCSLVSSRRSAAALVLAFIVLLFVGYLFVMASYNPVVSDTGSPMWQLAALWPATPFLTAARQWSGMPPLSWAKQDSWGVTSVVYLVIAALALAAASGAVKRFKGVRED